MNKITLTQLHQLAQSCPYDFAEALKQLSDDRAYVGQGADLSVPTLLNAYCHGVFPWFNEGEPIYWWSPNPRCVLVPSEFLPKKSLVRVAKKQSWTISTNMAFAQVVQACSEPRAKEKSTWITHNIKEAYQQLHQLGVANSIEVWQGAPQQSALIGGLYGLGSGAIFCGESMFHRQTDASKIAFWALMKLCQKQGIMLVDCQIPNHHLMSLGAKQMPREDFLSRLSVLVHQPADNWGQVLLPCHQLVDE